MERLPQKMETFRIGSSIPDAAASGQLLECGFLQRYRSSTVNTCVHIFALAGTGLQ